MNGIFIRIALSILYGVLVCYLFHEGLESFKHGDYPYMVLDFVEGFLVVVFISALWYGVTI